MSSVKICVLQSNLLVVVGIDAATFKVIRSSVERKGLDLHVLGFGDGSVMDLRDAPPEVSSAAAQVIEWVEARDREVSAADI